MSNATEAIFEPVEHEIDLVIARLNRAEDHYRSFGRIWAEYLADDPHSLEHTRQDDGTVVVRLRREHAFPIPLSLAFGELLYELRAALDNCLYAVAALVSGENPPPSAARLEWPIRLTPAEWKSQASRYRDLPSEITDALERIQPYQAECPDWNSLAILHDLARIDRHRSMHGLVLYLSEFRLLADNRHIEVSDVRPPGIVDENAQLVRMRIADGVELSPENFDLHLQFDVDIADVSESAGPSGTVGRPWGPLDNRLRALIKATRQYTVGILGIAGDYVEKRDRLSRESEGATGISDASHNRQ